MMNDNFSEPGPLQGEKLYNMDGHNVVVNGTACCLLILVPKPSGQPAWYVRSRTYKNA